MGAIMGGNVRVGLEDSLWLGRGQMAKGNAEQVSRIKTILENLSLEIASPYLTPWIDDAQVARDGIALVCPPEEEPCMRALARYAARGPAGRRVEVAISRSYFGVADAPDRFVIVTVPPRE